MAVKVVLDGGDPAYSSPQHTAVPLERSPQAWVPPELMAVKVSFVGTSVCLDPPPQHTAVPLGRSPQSPSMALSVIVMYMGVAVGVGESHPTGVLVGVRHLEGYWMQRGGVIFVGVDVRVGNACARALSEFGSRMSSRSVAAMAVIE